MIKTEIKLKEPIYYAPSYSGAIKVSIGKICDDIAIVKQYSKKIWIILFEITYRIVDNISS